MTVGKLFSWKIKWYRALYKPTITDQFSASVKPIVYSLLNNTNWKERSQQFANEHDYKEGSFIEWDNIK